VSENGTRFVWYSAGGAAGRMLGFVWYTRVNASAAAEVSGNGTRFVWQRRGVRGDEVEDRDGACGVMDWRNRDSSYK